MGRALDLTQSDFYVHGANALPQARALQKTGRVLWLSTDARPYFATAVGVRGR